MDGLADKLKGQTGGRRRKTGKGKKSRKNKTNRNKNMRRGGMGEDTKHKKM